MNRFGPFKMVLLGEIGVGKSSLALRFTKGQYHDFGESTIGAAFFTHVLQIDQNTSLKVELWDTAGQERFHSLAPMYYRGAPAALVVYDITNSESLRKAKLWVKEVREANGADMVIGLVGNKADLVIGNQRQVDAREAHEYAEENGLLFTETSAKRGDNVKEIFLNVARQVAAKQQINTSIKPRGTFPPSKLKSKESSTCCHNSEMKHHDTVYSIIRS